VSQEGPARGLRSESLTGPRHELVEALRPTDKNPVGLPATLEMKSTDGKNERFTIAADDAHATHGAAIFAIATDWILPKGFRARSRGLSRFT
jgi:hypothetical protein